MGINWENEVWFMVFPVYEPQTLPKFLMLDKVVQFVKFMMW